MTEHDRDLTENVFNPDATRDADAGPDAERERLVPAAGPGSLASPMESGSTEPTDDQSAGQDGGLLGQEGVAGGEAWEGKGRDIGGGGWTTGDAGFGRDTSDDGGPNRTEPDRTDLE
jgi:hypothetical protein